MQKLNLPQYSFQVKSSDGKEQIFDLLRKKYVRLTPEEWVRQNFIRYLVEEKGYPSALMVVEAGVNINNNPLRADLIVYGRSGLPLVAAEFKAPSVKITQQTFDQIVRYNMQLKVRFLMVSNGLLHYCCQIDYATNSYSFLPDIPDFGQINGG